MKKFFGLLMGSILLFSCNDSATSDKKDVETVASESAATPDNEFGDEKYISIAKKGLADLASGDIDSWMSSFADNAVYRWNNLDSLTGKAAIMEYWKKRRAEVIETLAFSNDIWLSVKVNKSQGYGQLTGNYALSWKQVEAKYKTGKTMTQRMHTVFHFDANDKIDRVTQYMDRASINAAMSK
ncbi:MAG TPA: nuclear transport factor 2 family protein [Chitinophagaceae bacterium]